MVGTTVAVSAVAGLVDGDGLDVGVAGIQGQHQGREGLENLLKIIRLHAQPVAGKHVFQTDEDV